MTNLYGTTVCSLARDSRYIDRNSNALHQALSSYLLKSAQETQTVRKLFTEAQRTVQCHQRCNDMLRRLLSKHETAWDDFFECVARVLVFGTRRNPDVERLVQFVGLASVSSVDRSREEHHHSLTKDASGISLLERTVYFLLGHSGAADKGVRFRCCQLLARITTEFSQIPGIGEEDLERVVRVLLPRLQDKEWRVREQAVVALRPFQFGQIEEEGDDGEDEEAFLKEDRVRTGLIGAMTSDSQPHVRQAALAAVTKTVKIIDELVLRTQDVDERVRKAAFRTLGEDVASKLLRPDQMLTLVKRGLSDKPAVADACRFMLCARWLKDVGYEPVELLKRVDVLQVEHLNLQDVPEMLVREIVQLGLKASRQRGDPSLGLGFTLPDAKGLRNAAGRRVHLGTAPAAVEGAEVPGEASDDGGHLSPEEALFARVQAEVIKDDKEMSALEKETRLEAILPDTTSLCEKIAAKLRDLKELLEGIVDGQEEEQKPEVADELEMRMEADIFVLQQLLKLAAHADFSEEAGRRRLVNLLKGHLVDVDMTFHLVESTMDALAAAHPSDADFVRVVAEIVSDMWDLVHTRQPGDTNQNTSSVSTSLDASFASALIGGGVRSGDTPKLLKPSTPALAMESGIRAAIPRNIVRDRARAIEGISPMEGLQDIGHVEDVGSGDPEDDEFVDARSHETSDIDVSEQSLRQAAVGNSDSNNGNDAGPVMDPAGDDRDAKQQRVSDPTIHPSLPTVPTSLDMLSALLTKTKQTLARDSTLRAFDEVIMDIFDWSARVLPSLCLDVRGFGPELLLAVITVRGKYSLLGDAETTTKLHGPFFLKIAQDREQWVGVRISALQALSDLSLIFRTTSVEPDESAGLEASPTLASRGDVPGLLSDIVKDRTADRALVAVAAEVVARFLFAELTYDPELLARMFVLYFEKGSAADSNAKPIASPEAEGQEEEAEEQLEGARTVGGSVRLSQILSVYFSVLPYQAVRPRVQDMLSESMRHVLGVLREIAKLNASAEASGDVQEDKSKGAVGFIDVPVQDVVGIAWRLLDKAMSLRPRGGNSSSSSPEEVVSVVKQEEVEGEQPGISRSKQQNEEKKDCSQVPEDETGNAVAGAAGHAALCITEELWTLGAVEGVSGLVESLAKVLKSLALPDDQTTLKRLRNNVDRLEVLGEGQLGSKLSKVIDKYAQVLLDADLTPEERIGTTEGRAREEAEDAVTPPGVRMNEKENGRRDIDEDDGTPVTQKPTTHKKRAKVRSKEPLPQASCGRPSRQSKVAARLRMANAEAAEAALDAADSRSDASGTNVEEGDDGDEGQQQQQCQEGGGARRASPVRGKGSRRSRKTKLSSRDALSEVDSNNSPEARRQSRS